MNKRIYLLLAALLSVLLFNAPASLGQNCTPLAAGCPSTDLSNAYLNSSNPNTITYDNMVSFFHSTIVRQANGKVYAWGQGIKRDSTDALVPQEINSANYPCLTGSVLRFTGASNGGVAQVVVLTTNGLFTWGARGNVLNSSLAAGGSCQKLTIGGKTDGLPAGVTASDVKMMYATFRMLTIVTCGGDVYTLGNASAAADAANYGDGSTVVANTVWHRVKTGTGPSDFLTGIVAVRGGAGSTSGSNQTLTSGAFMALKSDGTVWTWGRTSYLGDGSAATSRSYATQMTLPQEGGAPITPKTIMVKGGNNIINYYILSTAGGVYGLGDNTAGQLGNFNKTASNSWVRTQKSATAGDFLTDVKWISINQRDATLYGAVNAITANGTLYAWGDNSTRMLGGALPTPS